MGTTRLAEEAHLAYRPTRPAEPIHPERGQRQWGWPIAVYLYLAGVGAGSLALGLLADWFLHPHLPSAGLLLWGAFLVAVGAPFLVLDLGQKRRFLRASLNPKHSWAARGFVILSALIASGVAVFGLAVLPHNLPVIGWLTGHPVLVRALQITALVLSLGAAAYTGVFLKSVKHISLWNTRLLPLLFFLSALSTGAMALIAFLLVFGLAGGNSDAIALTRTLVPAAVLALMLESVALAWLLYSLNHGRRVPASTIRHLAVQSAPSLVLALVLMLSAWLAAQSVPAGVYSTIVLAGGAVVLVGGFMLRHDFVSSGVKNAHPMLATAPVLYSRAPLAGVEVAPAPVPVRVRIKAPARVPLARAPRRRAEQLMFEVAFSLFRGSAHAAERSRVRIMAGVYRSWRRPVSLEYRVDTE